MVFDGMKSYVINLPFDKGRLVQFDAFASTLGINYEVFSADETFYNEGRGVEGCWHSHASIAAKVKDNPIAVFEDDCSFYKADLADVVKEVEKIEREFLPLPGWDLFALGYRHLNRPTTCGDFMKLKVFRTSHAYILSPSGARKVSERYLQKPVSGPYDRYLSENLSCFMSIRLCLVQDSESSRTSHSWRSKHRAESLWDHYQRRKRRGV